MSDPIREEDLLPISSVKAVYGPDTAEARRFGEQALDMAQYCFKLDVAQDPAMWDLMCEEVSYIGPMPGMDDIRGKESYKKAIDLKFKHSFHHEKYCLQYSDGHTALVSGSLLFQTQDSEQLFLMAKQRFTMFFVNEGGMPKLLHIHISDPDNISPDNDFPYKLGRELKQYLVNMKEHAETDVLTSLHNRNYMGLHYDELNGALQHSAAKGQGLVFFFDLNGFKQVNDSMGHAAGDTILCIFARALRWTAEEALRQPEVMRSGGDEFIVIAPYDGRAEVSTMVRMLRREVAGRLPSNLPQVTFAMGFARAAKGKTLKELMLLADQRMYACKRRLAQLHRKGGGKYLP